MREALLGLAGHASSGKDTVAGYLVDTYGFKHVSTGDMVRFYMAERDIGPMDRDTMRVVATTVREEHGADYFARLALKNDASRLAISGMRTLADGHLLKKEGGIIIACTAPIELRFERLKARGRVGDDITFEHFKHQEELEASNPNPEAQNVSGVVAMADFTIDNLGDLKALHTEVDKVMKEVLKK